MLVNLSTSSILDKKTTENTLTTHPEDLAVHKSISNLTRPNDPLSGWDEEMHT